MNLLSDMDVAVSKDGVFHDLFEYQETDLGKPKKICKHENHHQRTKSES